MTDRPRLKASPSFCTIWTKLEFLHKTSILLDILFCADEYILTIFHSSKNGISKMKNCNIFEDLSIFLIQILLDSPHWIWWLHFLCFDPHPRHRNTLLKNVSISGGSKKGWGRRSRQLRIKWRPQRVMPAKKMINCWYRFTSFLHSAFDPFHQQRDDSKKHNCLQTGIICQDWTNLYSNMKWQSMWYHFSSFSHILYILNKKKKSLTNIDTFESVMSDDILCPIRGPRLLFWQCRTRVSDILGQEDVPHSHRRWNIVEWANQCYTCIPAVFHLACWRKQKFKTL